jgi:UDP-N-acetylmuramate dehydrogenase
MMAAERHNDHLIDRLPAVRGRLTADAPLHRIAWFRVGGPAEVLFEPADADDLAGLLAARPAAVPVTVIGAASNLLIRDGGVPGIVIHLGRGFAAIEAAGERVTAGAGAMAINVARRAAAAGLTGLEFLSGIPGSIGGALRMNAGAYGRETADTLIDATALDRQGRTEVVTAAEMGFSYRASVAPDDWIFVAARFRAGPGEATEIAARMAEIRDAREDSQPIRSRTGGSTFKNPDDATGVGAAKAWQLIDAAGCRGLTRGGARVSDLHCNFLINRGDATAADLEGLGEEVRRRVKETSGVTLDWEIRRIGVPAHPQPRGVAS